jgi:hypothetical protein
MEVGSTGSAGAAGLSISYGTARERIEAQNEEKELRSQLDEIYRELVTIRKSLEAMGNPLKLDRSLYEARQGARVSSSPDLGLSNAAPADADKALSSVAQFSSVSSGTITINGTDISIDVSADSLNDIVSRINASAGGVTASLFNSSQRFTLVSDSTGSSMVISSGSTGLFSALNMTDGTYNSSVARKYSEDKEVMPKARAARIAESLEAFSRAFNALFDNRKIKAEEDTSLEEFLTTLREDLTEAVQAGFGSPLSTVETDYGIAFDFGETATRVFDFSGLDKLDFIKKLTEEGSDVNSLFYARSTKDDDGLIEKIINALDSHETFLKEIRGTSGAFVDVQA